LKTKIETKAKVEQGEAEDAEVKAKSQKNMEVKIFTKVSF
jgi:hypothetical protein